MKLKDIGVVAKRRRLDAVVVMAEANVFALTGMKCDNAIIANDVFYTDFRYAAAVRRMVPDVKVADIKKFRLSGSRIGYESAISKAKFDWLVKLAPRKAKFVDIARDLAELRAVKSEDEIRKLAAAQRENLAIWAKVKAAIRPGMTERGIARLIREFQLEVGGAEAFDTIVCIGKNAAECHHEPDDTIWDGKEPILVDMGVKIDGYCSDTTRVVPPKRMSGAYRTAYEFVKAAHDAAIAAARPGMTAKALDKVARDIIRKGGFGKCFGHSLGHGVGVEIHEAPTVSKKGDMVLKKGMICTIEPGIYLEDNFGIRIEDMILITSTGCEVL